MEKEYMLVIFDKAGNVKDYYFAIDMKEIEERLFKLIERNTEFEIYHSIGNEDITKLFKYTMKRFIDNM